MHVQKMYAQKMHAQKETYQMSQSLQKISKSGLVMGLLLLFGLPMQAEEKPAIVAVQNNTDMLTKKLIEIKPIYEVDKEKFYAEVDETLSPLIDFEGFSEIVMAKYYKKASGEQKARFSLKFKQSLIEKYAEAMVGFGDEKIEVISEQRSKKSSGRSRVNLIFYGSDGSKYPISYDMKLSAQRWLLRNISINGINMGKQYRSQFTASMQFYKGNIDNVIANWKT